jgi:hypothetical protein
LQILDQLLQGSTCHKRDLDYVWLLRSIQ